MKRENLKNLSQSSLLNLLSEESGLICSYLKVFLFLNAAFVLVDAAVFVSVLAVPGFYIEGNGWGNFLAQLLGGLFIVQDGDGAHISYLALLLCAVSKILPNLITCYVFLALLRMFEKIKTGRTPFTELSSRMWRNCSHIYAVLSVLAFLSSFIFGIAGLAALLPYMMTYLFFHALELIFLYGEGLQTESDETW